MSTALSRREFLRLAACGVASATLLHGCGSASAENDAAGEDGKCVAVVPDPETTRPLVGDEFADRVNALATPESLVLLWATDIHLQTRDDRKGTACAHLEEAFDVASILQADAFLLNGDLLDGGQQLDEYHADVTRMRDTLSGRPVPLLPVRGNHDDDSYYTANITGEHLRSEVEDTAYLASNLIAPVADGDCVRDSRAPDSCYYYRDFSTQRIRLIVLDDSDVPYTTSDGEHLDYNSLTDFGFGGRQVVWLAEEALSLPENCWGVVVAAHVNFNDNRPYGLRGWGEAQPAANDSQVWQILTAFNTESSGRATNTDPDFAVEVAYDFSDQTGNELICCLNGHTHRDQCVMVDGVLNMTLRSFTEVDRGRYDAVVIDREAGMMRTRAHDTVSGLSPEWDIDYRTGSGVPTGFNYYRSGSSTDGLSVTGIN